MLCSGKDTVAYMFYNSKCCLTKIFNIGFNLIQLFSKLTSAVTETTILPLDTFSISLSLFFSCFTTFNVITEDLKYEIAIIPISINIDRKFLTQDLSKKRGHWLHLVWYLQWLGWRINPLQWQERLYYVPENKMHKWWMTNDGCRLLEVVEVTDTNNIYCSY